MDKSVETRLDFEIRSDYSNDVSALKCPLCGGENLHHYGVTVFDRVEDEENVTAISVRGGTAAMEIVPSSGSGNPSARRHGMAIQFTCEICDGYGGSPAMELTIAQHKGTTEIGWRLIDAPKV